MDTTPNSVTTDPRLPVSETGAANEAPSANPTPNGPVTDVVQDQNTTDSLSPAPVASVNQSESVSPRPPTPLPTVEPGEVIEHAYWAEFEEDTTTPGEEELKEIEGADADYSARDREFYPDWKELDQRLLTLWQTRIGRATSFGTWMTLSTSLGTRPV